MAVYYMTGTTTCRSRQNAQDNVDRYRKPAVIRTEDIRGHTFYVVTRLQTTPVQPGQFPFKIEPGEEVYYS
jgi:hypothetical protein